MYFESFWVKYCCINKVIKLITVSSFEWLPIPCSKTMPWPIVQQWPYLASRPSNLKHFKYQTSKITSNQNSNMYHLPWSILWTASSLDVVSTSRASNLVKLNFRAFPNWRQSSPTFLLILKSSSSCKTLRDFKHFWTCSLFWLGSPGSLAKPLRHSAMSESLSDWCSLSLMLK